MLALLVGAALVRKTTSPPCTDQWAEETCASLGSCQGVQEVCAKTCGACTDPTSPTATPTTSSPTATPTSSAPNGTEDGDHTVLIIVLSVVGGLIILGGAVYLLYIKCNTVKVKDRESHIQSLIF